MARMEKRLTKSRNRMIAGVCGGIADWLGWDPTIVRIAYLVLSIVSVAFPGIIVYVVLWIIMPPPE
jgi:phage shock protein C